MSSLVHSSPNQNFERNNRLTLTLEGIPLHPRRLGQSSIPHQGQQEHRSTPSGLMKRSNRSPDGLPERCGLSESVQVILSRTDLDMVSGWLEFRSIMPPENWAVLCFQKGPQRPSGKFIS